MTRTLLIACSSLALVGCGEPIRVNAPPPPPSWLQCAPLPETPALDPLEVVTLPNGDKVYLAAKVNERDGAIARYIVGLRAAHMDCQSAMQRLRDYYAGQE